MAPVAPNEKRKRGRPLGGKSDALQRVNGESVPKQDNLTQRNRRDGDTAEETRTKNRGRPRESDASVAEAAQVGPEQEEVPSNTRRSKRDRRSVDDNPYWISRPDAAPKQQEEQGEEEVADDAAPPKKRQRKAPVEEQANVGAAQPKRRGRPRTSVQEPEEAAEATQVAPRQSGPRKNGLRPRVEVTGEGQTEKLPKGGKKPRLSMSAMPYDEPRHRAKPKPHPSKRPSTASVIGQNKSAKPSKQSNQKNTSRRQSVADGSVEGPEEELSDSHKATLKYRQLESRPYHVSRTVISDKWTPLDDSSIKAVSAILADTTRFVLSQYQLQGAQERYHQTHEVLNKLSSRILLKLRNGLPFPPPTHKPTGRRSEGTSHTDELNIESTVDTIEASQRTLNPLLDSIKLLEAEKRKEEAALKDDYRNLTALEANAKSEARSWKENQRKKHALVVTGHEEDGVDDEDGLKLAKPRADAQPAALFGTTADDEEVVAMAHQISSHMESMRGNLQPLQDILPAMGKSKAALQTVLQKNLSAPQFERVLLG